MSDTEYLRVIYVHFVGVDSDQLNVYHFLLAEDVDDVFGEEWGEKPACNCNDLMPEEKYYDYIKELRTDIVLDLAQKNCCFSMQDAKDGIVALASENMDSYDEYPEKGRIIVHYGQSIDDVDFMLAKRDMVSKYI
ncbi:MAG: hypothetical protein LUD72_14255 [Bacteroidales bacterium]|nr:hypothetical protein [Bacteroidales bacterium]